MDSVWEYRGLLLQGTIVTVQLALASLALSVLLGLIGASAKLATNTTSRGVANAYTTLVRGVPDLVLMMLLFYGGQQIVNDLGSATGLWDYVEINQFIAGVWSIGFVFGAYMTETFRGAILAIPRGQIEAGISCGMAPLLIFRRITWPQMVRHALPSFTNNWLVLIKATALVSVIGLHDLVWNASTAGRSVREPFTFMFAVLIIYLILTACSDVGLRWLDRRYNVGVDRA
ncbi:MAG: ABC transporter [Acidiferrobacteraceae bacterium]|jgi:histidine transport system permease protein/arginine/ornithine transport system permease protein|nr:ABC transporter [Acidiferrobacteraceae bacterium]MCP4829868.1 ABC transporter permease subunit [Pseudomonadota bacterium]MDP6950559.1 ABC transporter permease subunit [Arenicellales bacterium]HJP06888.1 ABC transporter permease subunit [Arenicellales bacterium]|tara:strand:+ start:795 stop:1484 length:690 start_codon:yes stop_codon:yes gene_type:complete